MSTKVEGYLRVSNSTGASQCFSGNPEDARRLMIEVESQIRDPKLIVDYVLVSTTTTHIGVWQSGQWISGGHR